MITPQPHQKQKEFSESFERDEPGWHTMHNYIALNLLLMLHGFTSSSYGCFESLLQVYSNSNRNSP